MRDLHMEKKRIREEMRVLRKALPKEAQERASQQVYAQIIALDAYRRARCVMAYMACRGELDLAPVIEDILSSGRTLALPLCESSGIMTARRVTALSQLKEGAYDLPEPAAESEIIAPERIDLILVPGTAFDRTGVRIGQGGGYYDRFLRMTRATRVGICHDFALLERVPEEAHDEKMDDIVTPQALIDGIRDKQEDAR